jgi:hypothetical protein
MILLVTSPTSITTLSRWCSPTKTLMGGGVKYG